jgi:hypothetical protein
MKARLLFEEKDFDWQWALQAAAEREAVRRGRGYNRNPKFDRWRGLPWNAQTLVADLALDPIFAAMAGDDDCIFEVGRALILQSVRTDLQTVQYRQELLLDCLAAPAVVRELYAIAVEATRKHRERYLGILARYPDWVLRDATEAMTTFLEFLHRLRAVTDQHAEGFVAPGWRRFFAMVKRDLSDDYLAVVAAHLKELT